MFVALSTFVVANGMAAEVKAAFRDRPPFVDTAPGFVRLDVLTPHQNPEEIWLITYWTDEARFRNWHHGDAHHAAHRGIPPGLKLIPRETQLRFFDHVCS